MSDQDAFDAILAALEEADRELVAVLDRRARATVELHQVRAASPEAFFRVPRDEERIERARERVREFPTGSVEVVLREVFGACNARVKRLTVAILGTRGGFAHLAARRRFGSAANFQAFEQVSEVLEEVARGRAAFGVLPLETSSDGAITATLHGLAQSDARICAELTVQTSHHLLSNTGNLGDVDKVYGQRAALAACERFLFRELPRATVIDVPSGEVAAELSEADHGAAVIGTELLVELHALKIARERVEDGMATETRYAIVGSDLPSRTGVDRTVIAMAVHDEPGALYASLKPFADRDINLTRLESRPAPGAAWRYLFFVEMDGHVTDRPILTALEELRSISRHVRVLGSYPRPQTQSAV